MRERVAVSLTKVGSIKATVFVFADVTHRAQTPKTRIFRFSRNDSISLKQEGYIIYIKVLIIIIIYSRNGLSS
jgi:hypothetical protein